MTKRFACIGMLIWIAVLVTACSPDEGPQTGSQTNWLRSCSTSSECGSEACHCGVCTHPCVSDADCAAGLSCVTAQDPGAVSLCSGAAPVATGLCLERCGGDACGDAEVCSAGVCRPLTNVNAHVSINLTERYQQLVGFGATLAYVENDVVQSPNQEQLFDTMFPGLGLDILRLRNHYGYPGDESLTSAGAIVRAAAMSLGRQPTIILTSWSPPTSLKANGATICRGDEDNCTMLRTPQGTFDYLAYATYWRAAVDAYTSAGAAPDYVGIQNNPDFVPSLTEPGEGCKFLPSEGRATVVTSTGLRALEYPGYTQALQAVLTRFTDLSRPPRIIAPEVSTPDFVATYVDSLGANRIDAIGHHLYGSAPTSPDVSALRQLNELGQSIGRPVFQTEMRADGLGTAVLLHHTLVTEGASAYLHDALVGPPASSTLGANPLIVLGADGFRAQPTYHALRHYASHTDPGWVRVGTLSDHESVLSSAFLSPAGDTLTIVLVNPGADRLEVKLALDSWISTHVMRTAFDGTERSAELGELPSERVVQLPGHSMATVVVDR